MGADCLSKEDASVCKDVAGLQDCCQVHWDGSLVHGEARSGATVSSCVSARVQLDTDWFAECVEAFDEPCNVLWWKEEVGVVNE